MEKEPQANRKIKQDRPICEQCHDPKIVKRPDGTYRCKRCGYDSAT